MKVVRPSTEVRLESTVHVEGPGLQPADSDHPAGCWSTIGVEGNHTCPELLRHIHCHNCPVFSAAATQFLDRPGPPEYRREWTAHFARETKLAAPPKTSAVIFRIGPEWLALPTQAFQEVAEGLRTKTYGPDAGLRTRDPGSSTTGFKLHTLPHRRNGLVLGLVNVRGELLLCASLGRLLGLEVGAESTVRSPQASVSPAGNPARQSVETQSPGPGTPAAGRLRFDRLLVADWDGQRFAFPVDEVHGVHRFHSEDLHEPPATVATRSAGGPRHSQGVFPWRQFSVGFLDPDSLFASLSENLNVAPRELPNPAPR